MLEEMAAFFEKRLDGYEAHMRKNIAFSLALIEEKTGQRPREAGVLSSEYHMYRAKLVAREQGLEAIEIPARTSWISLRINYFLREIVAVWYYVLLGG